MKKRFPGAWELYDLMVMDKGNGLPDWPSWCYCPMMVSYAVAQRTAAKDVNWQIDISALTALAPWRLSKGIYRFDRDVALAVMDTPLEKSIPSDVLLQLPQWSLYIELPNLYRILDHQITGFFVHLDYSIKTQRRELRLVLDNTDDNVPLIGLPVLIDGKKTLAEGIAAILEKENEMEAEKCGFPKGFVLGKIELERAGEVAKLLSPLISLVLYLCARNAEVQNSKTGQALTGFLRPEPRKTKKGLKYFPPAMPEVWEVGFARGKQMREWGSGSDSGTHAGPRPHIRRAHWHTFWEGPKNSPESRFTSVKWLPPLPVNFKEGTDVVPTVYKVK